MYLNHYKLKAKPFEISCDPRFLWLGENHREALSMLRYGIMNNSGFLLLTGEVGTGKTVLINRLTTLLPKDTIVAHLSDPDLTCMDFFRLLADGLKLPLPFSSKGEFMIQLRKFLYCKATRNKPILLIIDEAQRLGHQLMEQIRVLSNIELHDRKLINIFFAGQQEFNQKLLRPENRALAQRITLRYQIEPLTISETGSYIRHRLKVAGRSRPIFKSPAVETIFKYSAGIPRIINIICDHALLTGYVQEAHKINTEIIEECAEELRIPALWGAPAAAIRPARPPSRIIGMPSTFADQNSKTDFASVQDEFIDIPPEQRRPLKHPPNRFLYPGTAALILIALALSLINIYGRSQSRHDELASLESQTTSAPETAKSTTASLRETAPRLNSIPEKKTAVNKSNTQTPSPGQTHRRKTVAKGALNSISKPVSTKKKIASLKKGPVEGLYRIVPIEFDTANRIANQSQTAINKVATYLLNNPQKVIYIYGQSGKAILPKQRRIALRQQIDTLKTYLVQKGAYPSQIRVFAGTTSIAARTADKRSGNRTVIEFPQNHIFSDYNPDK